MHELSIALNIVDGALDELHQRRLSQAAAVHLRLGRLAGVDKDALLFSYGIAAQDTALESSRLLIEDVDVVIFCETCKTERATRSFPLLVCAQCGGPASRVVHGNELEISGMEVET